jgi:dihydropteroate synthase
VEYGAEILHDPSGLVVQPALAKVASAASLGLLLSHMRGEPLTWARMTPLRHAPLAVARELNASAARAIRDGVDRRHLMVDPGLGQGKRKEQDLELLAYSGEIVRLELPVSYSLSSPFAGAPGAGSLAAAVALAVRGGVHAIRTYDVSLAKEAMSLADAVLPS